MSLKNKKVLLTYGPTAVPIDNIRVITNISTGALGRILVEELIKKDVRLTILEGPVREPCRLPGVKRKPFYFFDDLKRLIIAELKHPYDILIHAAAVSDYRARKIRRGKIGSGRKDLRLSLIPTPKLIGLVKKRAPDIFLVGFKLETTARPGHLSNKGRELIRRNHCDLTVANALTPDGGYAGLILDRIGHILARAGSRRVLARQLIRQIESET